jgi:hypothetical protein
MISRDLKVIVDTVDGFPPDLKRSKSISSDRKNEGVVPVEDTSYGLFILKRDGCMFSEGRYFARFGVKTVIHPCSCSHVKFLFMLSFPSHENLPSFLRVDNTLIQSERRVNVNINVIIMIDRTYCSAGMSCTYVRSEKTVTPRRLRVCRCVDANVSCFRTLHTRLVSCFMFYVSCFIFHV